VSEECVEECMEQHEHEAGDCVEECAREWGPGTREYEECRRACLEEFLLEYCEELCGEYGG